MPRFPVRPASGLDLAFERHPEVVEYLPIPLLVLYRSYYYPPGCDRVMLVDISVAYARVRNLESMSNRARVTFGVFYCFDPTLKCLPNEVNTHEGVPCCNLCDPREHAPIDLCWVREPESHGTWAIILDRELNRSINDPFPVTGHFQDGVRCEVPTLRVLIWREGFRLDVNFEGRKRGHRQSGRTRL